MNISDAMKFAVKYAKVSDSLSAVAFCWVKDPATSLYSVRYGARLIVAQGIPEVQAAQDACDVLNSALGVIRKMFKDTALKIVNNTDSLDLFAPTPATTQI